MNEFLALELLCISDTFTADPAAKIEWAEKENAGDQAGVLKNLFKKLFWN